MNPFWQSEFSSNFLVMQITAEIQLELSFLCKPRSKNLNFLSFGRQKQTPLLNISLVIFVFRAVLMRKQTQTELSRFNNVNFHFRRLISTQDQMVAFVDRKQ